MRMIVADSITTTFSKTDSVKEFTRFMREHSQTDDKSFVRRLMSILTTMKLNGSQTFPRS